MLIMSMSRERCNLYVFTARPNILANWGAHGVLVAIISRSDPVLGRSISGCTDLLPIHCDNIPTTGILTF